ncbi:hypothetical protein BH10CYA1_BH10CYA1_42360 [soil metagenome]
MAKEPITLSGKVYVGDYLAPYYPERKLPAQLQVGDIKVDSHLDDRGRANREAKTAKARKRGFSGYFTGVLWDGAAWRRFAIRTIVGSDGWYTSQKWKRDKIYGVFWSLEAIAGRVAVVGDGTYELSPKGTVAEAPPPPPPVVQDPQPVKEVVPVAKPVQLSLF